MIIVQILTTSLLWSVIFTAGMLYGIRFGRAAERQRAAPVPENPLKKSEHQFSGNASGIVCRHCGEPHVSTVHPLEHP